MSMGPLVSHRAGIWLIDECQMAFFHELSYVKKYDPPFCRYFLCHLSYCQQFVWYPGYHGYQFYATLLSG